MPAEWQSMIPELPVNDVHASQSYYGELFDCRFAWCWPDGSYGAVIVQNLEILFYRCPSPVPAHRLYIRVTDVDQCFNRYRNHGAQIIEAIESKPWGMRQFSLQDLDGHRLTFGQAIEITKEIGRFRAPKN